MQSHQQSVNATAICSGTDFPILTDLHKQGEHTWEELTHNHHIHILPQRYPLLNYLNKRLLSVLHTEYFSFLLKCERIIICKEQSKDIHCNDLLKQIRVFSFSPTYPISLHTDPETRENTFIPFHVYLILLPLPPFVWEISVCYHFYFHIVTQLPGASKNYALAEPRPERAQKFPLQKHMTLMQWMANNTEKLKVNELKNTFNSFLIW